MTKRDVPAPIGWIGMAWLTPVFGALLYVGFGINRVKRRARRLKGPEPDSDAPVTGDISSMDAIESAKCSMRLATYIFRGDEIGMRFIDALARAHRRGVEIRVLIDGFGGG